MLLELSAYTATRFLETLAANFAGQRMGGRVDEGGSLENY